jgi:hypothetical protein
MKNCIKCGLEKPHKEFYSQRKQCKNCYNLSRSEKYNQDVDYRKKRARQIQNRKYYLRKTDLPYNLRFKISQRIRHLAKNGKCSKKLLVEYNIDANEIIKKIGLKPGDDYHLDHIIPVSAFDHNDLFEVWCCWNYRNLQWMLAKENISKKDKYDINDKVNYFNEMGKIYEKEVKTNK